ncbi:MAG: alpha/beta hydrolase-fold protein [Gemmatimonadaceae bacterium]
MLLIPRVIAVAGTFVMIGCALSTGSSPASSRDRFQAAAPSQVVFPTLARGSVPDCDTTANAVPCRLRWPIPTTTARNFAGSAFVRGDTLTFVAASSDSVELLSPFRLPMARVGTEDLWVASLRVHDLDHAMFSYVMLAKTETTMAPKVFLGPQAPRPMARAMALRGAVRTDSLSYTDAHDVRSMRAVVSYVPEGWQSTVARSVVYMGDGNAVRRLAPLLDTLITTHALPLVALVGVAAAPVIQSQPESEFGRAREYVFGFQADTAAFLTHERFVLETVIPWAERTLAVPHERGRRFVWGYSNSGAFAVTVAHRNPSLFSVAMAASLSGDALPPGGKGEAPAYFLTAGTFEKRVLPASRALREQLEREGSVARLDTFVSGHDAYAWEELFVPQLRWALSHSTAP